MTDTIYDQLLAAVRRVAEARTRAADEAAYLASERAAFDAAHAELIAAVKGSAASVAAAEATAKALADAHFRVTGEKHPVPGIVVKERTTLAYDDAAALAWAKASGIALVPETFDRKALEKVAKATPLPFVTVTTEPMVTLASDIPAVLSAIEALP